jgi:serine/threonine protein kinase
MGIVYLAEHPALGRKAAIKVLHPKHATDPEVVSRFFQEARASNAIRHPNIVETYDYGTLPNGAPYIIMEHLEGESLATRLQRVGKLPLHTALDFAQQVAGALAAAHEKSIVHRDLKPDNLFVTRDLRAPRTEQVKILDFGIAKLVASLENEVSHKTRTGTLMGTPLYMSPEQCLGVREVDHRTDIYSLGCILHEMLTGAPPFVSEGFGALVNMHINQPPPRASRAVSDVPGAVDRLVLKMLSKKTDDRPATMLAVQEALLPEMARAPVPRPSEVAPDRSSVPRALLNATTLSAASGATRTAPPEPGPRRVRGALVVGGLALVAVGALVLLRAPSAPPSTQRAPESASVAAPPAAPPVAPAPVAPAPAPAAPVEARLESTPPGALVSVDGVAIGTTPMTWRTAPTARPTQLTFSLDGYRSETIAALPSAGLRLAPTLKRVAVHHARAKRAGAAAPVDDIKSER